MRTNQKVTADLFYININFYFLRSVLTTWIPLIHFVRHATFIWMVFFFLITQDWLYEKSSAQALSGKILPSYTFEW